MSEVLKIVIGGDTKKFDAALKQIKDKNKALESDLVSIGKKATVAFAAFGGAIGLAVNQAAKFEAIQTQFEVLTGSAERAKKVVEDLTDFTAKTPFQFEGVAAAGKQLLGFGFEVDEIEDKLQNLGDVAAASGRPINEISLIFGQVSAAGKLTGERLLQFQERAIPIGPALAETMGVAESSIKDLVSAGKVDFETFEKAFQSLSEEGGFAFEGLIKQSKTASGVFSTLKDNIGLFLADVGKRFLPVIKSASIAVIEFLNVIRKNEAIARTAAVVLGLGTVVTGATAAFAFGAVGIIKFKKALDIAIISVKAMSFSIKGLVAATGLGLLLILLADLAVNWETRWKQMTAIFRGFANNVSQVGLGLKNVLQGIFTFDKDQIVQGFSELKEAISKSFDDVGENFRLIDQEQLAQDEELAQESAENIAETKRNLNAKDADLVQSRNDRIKKLNDELRQAEYESRLEDSELKKEQELEHQAAMLELRNEYRNLDLQAEQEIEAEKTKAELEEKKRRIKEEKKYGKTVADLKAMLRHEDVQGAKDASNQLIQLQSSESETLKGIGKAAALVRVGVKTAEGAISAYSALAGIPIVGPGLGAAAAAALIAFGGEQAAKITAANQGGVITGGIAGVDSVPAMLTPGELVTPEKNFDEVVNAVANQRMQERGQVSGDGSSAPAEIVLSLKDDLVEFIEAQLIERGRLNIGLGIA